MKKAETTTDFELVTVNNILQKNYMLPIYMIKMFPYMSDYMRYLNGGIESNLVSLFAVVNIGIIEYVHAILDGNNPGVYGVEYKETNSKNKFKLIGGFYRPTGARTDLQLQRIAKNPLHMSKDGLSFKKCVTIR